MPVESINNTTDKINPSMNQKETKDLSTTQNINPCTKLGISSSKITTQTNNA